MKDTLGMFRRDTSPDLENELQLLKEDLTKV